jgi:hypothetical protein
VDIDGATQIDATVTVGIDDTGYDVKFFGATAGAYMLWDESADDLILGGAAGLSVNSTALVTGVLTTTAATVFTGGFAAAAEGLAYFDLGAYSATASNNVGFRIRSSAPAAAGEWAGMTFQATTGDSSGTYWQQGITSGSGSYASDFVIKSSTGASSMLERLRINSSGNVGIGTTSPVASLSVQRASAASSLSLRHTASGNGYGYLVATTGTTTNDLVISSEFNGSATERMRIDSSGNVGIGIAPQSFSDLMVNTATDRNIGIFDNALGTTIGGITDAGASAALRLAGSPLVMTGGGGSGATHMTVDSEGNVGIGVVPEAWSALFGTRALQVGAQASLSNINGDLHLSSNAYYDATDARWEYINADYATKYTQVDGIHQWLTAASGSADAAITWSESMRINSSGDVGIGTSSPTNTAGFTTLGVNGSTGGIVEFRAGDVRQAQIYATTGTMSVGSTTSIPLLLGAANSEAVRIHASGGLSFANTTDVGPYNAVLGYRNNHFTGQRSNTVAAGDTSTVFTLVFGLNGAAIVRVVDTGTVVASDYFACVYEYFVTCYNNTVTATLKQSQAGGGSGSLITTSTSSATFNVIQTGDASRTTWHDTAIDVLVVAAGNGSHATATITMAANN